MHLCLLPSLQVPAGCCVEPVAAFQLAYQGYPWKPAKGYETLGFQMFVFFQSKLASVSSRFGEEPEMMCVPT